ncbi:MAG: hypothetical protein CVU79_02225 [Elusimicrobia bacterium HGW-Elusimicrobia-3]|jgi:GT2 family glycosyltransferase|nr:MAG: hypothetical protein CVU79_02225 [Elusimicrobia bacterium HGW-Elusimicrobia-3]
MTDKGPSERIAAVVVTHDRPKLLLECLASLIAQSRPLDAILIIDNASEMSTREALHAAGFTDSGGKDSTLTYCAPGRPAIQIRYLRLEENTGGSGGFKRGMELGYNSGFDWLWLMDDDSEPELRALELLLAGGDTTPGSETLLLASKVINEKGETLRLCRGWFDKELVKHNPLPESDYRLETTFVGYATFVGFLVSRRGIAVTGYPDEGFFILYDDLDYSLRLARHGKLLLVNSSVVVHKELMRSAQGAPAADWKRYYRLRNRIFCAKRHGGKTLPIIVLFAKLFLNELTRARNAGAGRKGAHLRLTVKAYFDGIFGYWGKRVEPGSC